MGAAKRTAHFLAGLLMLFGCYRMLADPAFGYYFVIVALDLTLLLAGVRMLIYYFSLARYMVDGYGILYKSIILLDAGMFMFTIDDIPQFLAMLYLIGCLAFTGFIRIYRGIEAKGIGARSWKNTMFIGCARMAIALSCLFFLDSVRALTLLYCFGLANSAIIHILTSLRKTAVVYIEP